MPLPVVYRREAEIDIIEASLRYERERPGLGALFLDEIARIDVRRAVFRRFPFGIFYIVESERVVVVACLNLRRDPNHLDDIVTRRTS